MAARPPDPEQTIAPQDLLRRQKRRRPPASWLSALLAAAMLAVIAWFAWTAGLFVSERKRPPKVDATMLDKRAIAVNDTRIMGADSSGQPFVLRARVSVRADDDKNLVHMRDVSGELRKNDGERIVFRADRADYDRGTEQAVLMDNVRIRSEGRYDLLTSRARIDTRSKKLSSDSPVTVLLSGGRIEARGIRTGENMDAIRFPGPVRAHFDKAGGTAGAGKGARLRPQRRN